MDLGYSRPLFFPKCDPKQLGYDCAPKAINYALGFAFFTQREQLVNLMRKMKRISEEQAAHMKALGGIDFDCLHQFAVAHERAYSFVKVESFSRRIILDERDQLRDAKDNAYRKHTPGHLIVKYVTDHMIKSDDFKDLVIVFRGQIWDHFAHAATFKQFTYNGVKQVALLDCKNDIKLFIGKKQPDQDVVMEQVRPD